MKRSMQTPVAELRTVTQLRRLVAAFAICLFAATYKLWLPKTDFPQVPLFSFAVGLPWSVDAIAFGAIVVALVAVLLAPRESRWWRAGCGLFIVGSFFSVLGDQHRLQPWAYQFALVLAFLALVPNGRGLTMLRILTISIYMHSALSKLDESFFETNGPYLVSGVTSLAGLQLEKWSASLPRYLAAALPLGELVVAIGLCFRRARLFALFGAVAMHALLIVALGPWSLDHEWGVLIWNAYFIAQNVLLFGRNSERTTLADFVKGTWSEPRSGIAASVLALVVLLPFLEPWGYFDPWPGWALYANRPARARVFVDANVQETLPVALKQYVQEPRFSDGLCLVRIDRWSLDTTGAPVYPSVRFELGVALALMQLSGTSDSVYFELESAADRWTGKRDVTMLSGDHELRLFAESFLLNAEPRLMAKK